MTKRPKYKPNACVYCGGRWGCPATERTIGAGRPCCYPCFRVRWVF